MTLKKAVYTVTSQPVETRGFEDLEVYKLALDVMVNAHAIAKNFPAEEKYDLTVQLRRASKSAPANIAEGYGRYHYLDSVHFYYIARGSINEVIHHFITAKLLDYIAQTQFDELYALARRTERALNGYIAWVKKQKQGQAEYGDKALKERATAYLVSDDIYEEMEFDGNKETQKHGNKKTRMQNTKSSAKHNHKPAKSYNKK